MHAMAAVGNRLYVFGGRLRQAQPMKGGGEATWGREGWLTNELWSFDVLHFTWTLMDEVRLSLEPLYLVKMPAKQ